MAIRTDRHISAAGFTATKALEISRRWFSNLVDATLTYLVFISAVASITSVVSPGRSAAVVYETGLSVPQRLAFFLLVAGLVWAGFFAFVLPNLSLLDDYESPIYDKNTLSGFLRQSFANFSGMVYTGVVIWIAATTAFAAYELGFVWFAPWILLGIPAFEFLSISWAGNSPLSAITMGLLLLFTPWVFISAFLVYTVRKRSLVRSAAVRWVRIFGDTVKSSTTPGAGSLIDELLLISRQRR